MAILYGTQSNGETLPVLVDQYGNLIAKGIEGPQGESGEDGAPGLPGGQGPPGDKGDPGEGVPLPYGEEGSFLTIKDGVPAWTSGEDPTPTPEPDGVIWTNVLESGNLVNEYGQSVQPPYPWNWVSTLPSWGEFDNYDVKGSAPPLRTEAYDATPMHFEFENMFGKVLTMHLGVTYDISVPFVGTWTNKFEFSDTDIKQIAIDGPTSTNAQQGVTFRERWLISYIFNRNVSSADWILDQEAAYTQIQHVHFRGWIVEDPGMFALRRQLELEKRLKSGMAMDIDE